MNVQDSVLYGLLTFGPDCWYQHGSTLEPEMFDGDRREVFEAIAKLNREGKVSDAVLVASSVGPDAGEVALQIAGQAWISAAAMKSHVEHLRAAWQINRARDIGAALAETGDADTARSDLMALEASALNPAVSIEDARQRLMEDLSARTDRDVNGLQTGLRDLDALLGGIEPGDLCIVAARPRIGKTAFLLNLIERSGVPAMVFSLEMSVPQLMTRLLAQSGIDYGKLRHPKRLSDHEWRQITEVTSADTPGLWINDTGGLSIDRIEAESYRMVKAKGVQLVAVDYLQLVTCKAESRFQEVSEVSRRLKALAKNLKVPVIALCQVSRDVEKHGKGRMTLADLRESGQIEQDADQVIFLHRPEVYAEGVMPGLAEMFVEKNRGGETGKVKASWQGKYQRFMDFIPDYFARAVAS